MLLACLMLLFLSDLLGKANALLSISIFVMLLLWLLLLLLLYLPLVKASELSLSLLGDDTAICWFWSPAMKSELAGVHLTVTSTQ